MIAVFKITQIVHFSEMKLPANIQTHDFAVSNQTYWPIGFGLRVKNVLTWDMLSCDYQFIEEVVTIETYSLAELIRL